MLVQDDKSNRMVTQVSLVLNFCNTEDLLIFRLESSSVPFFLSSVTAVFDKGQPLVYTFIPSFIPNMIL